MYRVGDKVVYPHHGAGKIMKIEDMEVRGQLREYLTIQILHNDMTVMVPVDSADRAGLRKVVASDVVDDVLAVLHGNPTKMPKNWSRRYKHNRDKLKTGDIFEVAEVVRNLAIRHCDKGLSTGEKQMFSKAKKILASELMYARDMNEEQANAFLDTVLDEVGAAGAVAPIDAPDLAEVAEVAEAAPAGLVVLRVGLRSPDRAGRCAPFRLPDDGLSSAPRPPAFACSPARRPATAAPRGGAHRLRRRAGLRPLPLGAASARPALTRASLPARLRAVRRPEIRCVARRREPGQGVGYPDDGATIVLADGSHGGGQAPPAPGRQAWCAISRAR